MLWALIRSTSLYVFMEIKKNIRTLQLKKNALSAAKPVITVQIYENNWYKNSRSYEK